MSNRRRDFIADCGRRQEDKEAKMKAHPAVFVLTVLVLLLPGGRAEACSCLPARPPCETYWKTDAVFTGLVTDSSIITVEETSVKYQQRAIRIALDQAYRGVEGTEVEIFTSVEGGACGYNFKKGERYIVYAHRGPTDGKLSTSICSRTKLLSEAKEDLEYLHGLSSAEPGATIYGQVKHQTHEIKNGRIGDGVPLEGITVIIEGHGKRLAVVTDGEGRFRVVGLRPGSYRVKALLPENLDSSSSEADAKVADRGCAAVNITAESNGRVNGRVFDDRGRPAPDVKVGLIGAEVAYVAERGMTVRTDAEGLYQFKRVRPGRYLLGVGLDWYIGPKFPFPRTYFPGVRDPAQATVINLGEGQKLQNYDLHLPPPLAEQTIEGVVVWLDGSPAAEATVTYSVTEVRLSEDGRVSDELAVDAKAGFSFKGYEGVKYNIQASVQVNVNERIYTDPVEVLATGKLAWVKLMIPLRNTKIKGSAYLRGLDRRKFLFPPN